MSLTQFAVHWWPSFLAAAPHRVPTPADQQLVVRIRTAADSLRERSAQELQNRVAELRRAVAGQGLAVTDPRVIEPAFALVHEAVRRCVGLEYYDVQFVAGLALARGQIAELATGEGKTLVQALAAFVFALRGKGVHVMTSNTYLAERDCRQLAPVLRLLGLAVGLVRSQASPQEKQQAYLADVTYGPGYEFGFDYLRDQITKQRRTQPQLGESYRRQFRGERLVEPLLMQRGHAVAVIDEADSVLIDEATLPLILAANRNVSSGGAVVYHRAAAVASRLNAATDFVLDQRRRRTRLTDTGLNKVMDAGCLPDCGLLEQAWPAYVEQALVAQYLLCRDVDYVVDQDQVMLVDESTGRVFADRSLRHGLHQAVEAKEQVAVTAERRALARISRQQLFRLYETLCGMTGTAQSGEREFRQIYHLGVTVVPPRHACRRTVIAPRFFSDKWAKRNAVVAEIRERQAVGQPVLVGTRTIEESRRLAELLRSASVEFELLDGTQDAEEARVVAQAGQLGAVTIATNIAGRGTDIRLAPGVAELGGLHVIATEPHASRRVDRQLLGRSARQGDPGSCRRFASADDDLIRLHAPRLSRHMRKLADAQGEIHRDFSHAIETLQRRVEQVHRQHRRQMLRYDAWMEDVMANLHGSRVDRE